MRNLLLTLVALVSLGSLVACGGGSLLSTTPIPPSPSGGNNAGYTNSSLSGTYVFAVNGITNSNYFAVVGAFTADGNGNITSGTRDTVNNLGGQVLDESITGTYSVNQDGRGQMILSGSSTSNQVIYRFVMQATSAGTNQVAKVFQVSNTTDATGRIELQTGTPSASGTYVVRLDGEDSTTGKYNYGAIGGLTFNGGTITGAVDENDAGYFPNNFNAQLAATGSYSISATRGAASFVMPNDPLSGNNGTHNFIVYYVSPNRLEMVSTNTNFWLHGYANLQTSTAGSTAAFSGPQVFNLSGIDSYSGYPLIQTGRLTLDGSGNVTNGTEDYNENLYLYPDVNFSGSYSVASTGRWTATLSTPGSFISSLALVGWQVSPSQSMLITQSAASSSVSSYGVLETGDMRAQTLGLTDSSVSGNYANNLSGFANYSNVGNVEFTGNYYADGNGNLSGTIDWLSDFDDGVPTVNSAATGNYVIDPTYGRGSGNVDGVPVEVYTVNADTMYLISTDPASVLQGQLAKQ